MRIKHIVLACAFLPLAPLLTGCSGDFSTQESHDLAPDIVEGIPFSGSAYGGQQPITNSRLYMFAADTTGYGHASDSLIQVAVNPQFPSQLDTNGNYYIQTDPTSGDFSLVAGQYACSVGQQVYLYILGGDTGLGSNSAISEIAILGTCNASGGFSQLTGSFIYMNEVSTVAAAYALAGFASDATHISASSTALAGTGLLNAFNNAPNIYNINGGPAQGSLAATPQGSGTVPETLINSLADILASCINSDGPSSANCSTLLSAATNSSGTAAGETSTAMINIAHNPAANISTLFTLFSNVSPFQPSLTTQPPDFSVILTFANGASSQPVGMAVDAAGDIWITNNNQGTITELAPSGKVLSGIGYTDANLLFPTGIAIDATGNAWVVDESGFLVEIGAGGTSYNDYSGADLNNDPLSIAIDAHGLVWVGQNNAQAVQFGPGVGGFGETLATSGGALKNQLQEASGAIAIDSSNNAFFANYEESASTKASSVSKFSSNGTALSSGTGFGYNLNQRNGSAIAIDASQNFWMTNIAGSVTVGNNAGTAVILASGSSTTGACPAGISLPEGIAFDGSSNAWIANNSGTLSELNSAGNAVSGCNGLSGTTNMAMSGIQAIAVDGSGNVWAANHGSGSIYEFVGAGTPVVTPIVAGLTSPYTPASRP
jgi:streptogramin lyase